MSITVRYFASLRDAVGRSEDRATLTGPLPVKAVWQQINPQLALPDNVLAAVNMEYANLDTVVEDGDELAFFPPVTGG